jgi:hypothetical protein
VRERENVEKVSERERIETEKVDRRDIMRK